MPLNVPNQRILTKKNSFTLSNIMFSLQHLNIEINGHKNIIRCNLINVKYFNLPDLK